MVVNLADIVRRTNALSEITFHPHDLIRQLHGVQNVLPLASRSPSLKTARGGYRVGQYLGEKVRRGLGRSTLLPENEVAYEVPLIGFLRSSEYSSSTR